MYIMKQQAFPIKICHCSRLINDFVDGADQICYNIILINREKLLLMLTPNY